MTSLLSERRLNVILAVVIGTAPLLLLGNFITASASLSAQDLTEQAAITNDLASCRDEAKVEVDVAALRVSVADDRVDAAFLAALQAIAESSGPDLSAAIVEAGLAQVDKAAASAALAAATETYVAQITQSREDPATFLDACRRSTP